MIVFDLACECGLIFEGWFGDRADFERQEADGLLVCPACGGGEVRKILSPVRRYSRGQGEGGGPPVAAASPEAKALELLKTLQNYVLDNFEDVGSRLCEESLKVRFGLAKERNIRGVVTEAEEKMLDQEGIKLLKIPLPAKPEEDA
jgi:hypothetical protein